MCIANLVGVFNVVFFSELLRGYTFRVKRYTRVSSAERTPRRRRGSGY